jgi:ATP/ADP translocase
MQTVRINPIYVLFGLILPIILLFLLLRFAKILWLIGMCFTPILLAIAYFTNKKPILDHLKMLGGLLRENSIKGVFYTLASVFALPFLSLFFIGKALFLNKVAEMTQDPNNFANAFFGQQTDAIETQKQQKNAEYADYEEIETIIKE